MKLNPDDLQVASFTTAPSATDSSTDPQYPPTHPTEQTYCFVCPVEPWTVLVGQ